MVVDELRRLLCQQDVGLSHDTAHQSGCITLLQLFHKALYGCHRRIGRLTLEDGDDPAGSRHVLIEFQLLLPQTVERQEVGDVLPEVKTQHQSQHQERHPDEGEEQQPSVSRHHVVYPEYYSRRRHTLICSPQG